MTLVSVRGGKKYFGDIRLFDNVNFHVDEGQKVGLVGVNGAGKTSLFQVITGAMVLDEGEVYVHPASEIGYMKQTIEYHTTDSLWEAILKEFAPLIAMEEELSAIQKALETAVDEKLIRRQDALMQNYEREGGFEYRSRARGALIGLGFRESDFDRPFRDLSGGEKTRLLLAKLLLGRHKLLLLDEPTNHLDMASVEWLEGFLKSYAGSFIVISHDRYFLDRTTNTTFGLQHGKVRVYQGSYSAFVEKREADEAARAKKYELQQKEIKRIQGIIAQQKQWGRERNIKTAESKQKMIDRIVASLDAPEEREAAIRFSFQVREGGANEVLTLRGIDKRFGEKQIADKVDMDVMRGQRVFLIGNNGCGKTTLLKMILGQETPDGGVLRLGNGITVGYYEQQHTNLTPEKTVFGELADAYPRMDRTRLRSALAAFLFRGEDCEKRIRELSGGERARVLLAKIMLSEANFLILDEPTNHLDIFSKEALEDALRNYEGTLLVVSHDRYFINGTADKIYAMDEGRLTCYAGDYDYYLEKSRAAADEDKALPACAAPTDYQQKKEHKAAVRKTESLIAKTEEQIAEAEARLAELEELLFSEEAKDIGKAMTWHEEKEEKAARLEALYQTWNEAQESLALLSDN